jgi:hypothetical protein
MSEDICWVHAHRSHPDAPWNQPDDDDLTFEFEVNMSFTVWARDKDDAQWLVETLIKPSPDLIDTEITGIMEI